MPPRALPRRRPPSLNLVLCGAPEKRPGPAPASGVPSSRGAKGGPGHSASPAARAGVTPAQAPQAACERGWTKATPEKCMIVQQLLPAGATLRGQGPSGAAALRQKDLCGHSPECGARGARPRRGQRRGAAPQAGCASTEQPLRQQAGTSPAAPSGAGAGPLTLPGSSELLPPPQAARSGQLPRRRLLEALTDLPRPAWAGRDQTRPDPTCPPGSGRGGCVAPPRPRRDSARSQGRGSATCSASLVTARPTPRPDTGPGRAAPCGERRGRR